MIKKDISYLDIRYQTDEREKVSTNSVDDIFANADSMMEEQKRLSSMNLKNKKKNKKHRFLRFLISSLIIFLMLVGILVALCIHSVRTMYPQIKANVLEQISLVREELMSFDDSELTVDQYYQKQLLLLFTGEDFEAAIEEFEDIDGLLELLMSGGTLDLSIVSEEKVDEYKKLIEEYEKAKISEADGKSNMVETINDSQEMESVESDEETEKDMLNVSE